MRRADRRRASRPRAGFPDFRSPTGIWAEVDPFEVASIQAFRRDPERVWSFYRTRIHSLLDAEPNAGHVALAELERRGLVQRGRHPEHRHAAHAAPEAGRWSRCTARSARRRASSCLWTEGIDGVLAQLEERPRSALHPLRRDPEARRHALRRAAAGRARSSVRPSSRARLRSCSSSARRSRCGRSPGFRSRRAPLAIVNRGATALDDRAILKIDARRGGDARRSSPSSSRARARRFVNRCPRASWQVGPTSSHAEVL